MAAARQTNTFSSMESEIAPGKSVEVELWEGHSGDESDGVCPLPLIHQMLIGVSICRKVNGIYIIKSLKPSGNRNCVRNYSVLIEQVVITPGKN